MTKVRVDIEEVMALKAGLSKIDRLEFNDIVWFKDGDICDIDQGTLDDWRFTGLSNSSFVEFNLFQSEISALISGKS